VTLVVSQVAWKCGGQQAPFAVQLAAGGDHTVVLTRSGQLLTCGNGENGELGHCDRKMHRTMALVQQFSPD
jgi:alpha-tubulin suppressor-like RCC1 family protein